PSASARRRLRQSRAATKRVGARVFACAGKGSRAQHHPARLLARMSESLDDALQRGRTAYDRQAWSDAYAGLAEADRMSPLDAADLDRLATTAHLIGLDDVSADARTRAFQAHLQAGDRVRAAASAIGRIFLIGDQRKREAEMGGWIA